MARTSRKNTTPPVKTTLEPLWNTCIYARLSFEDHQKQKSQSIDNQIAMLKRYIRERPYLKLVSVFKDINQTGTNFERAGFNKMMEAVKQGEINCIVVKDLSRFGRNYIETGTYLEKILPFFHVRFISVNDGYDSLNPNNQDAGYVVPLKNLIHDMYARDISTKTKSSLAVKRSKGEFTGCIAAYGYLKAKDGRLKIDEETAPVVRNIFKWARDGMGDTCIAQRLNELGVASPSQYRYINGVLKREHYANKRYWYKSAVCRILANPVYLGHMVQGKTRSDLWGNGGCVDIPREEWVEIKHTHEPLVDEETFFAVRQIKQERGAGKKNSAQTENVLKGQVFCGDCKRRMKRRKITRSNGTASYYFTCATYEDISKNDCTKKRMEESELLEILYSAIRGQIDLADNIERLISKLSVEERFGQHQGAILAEISETEKKLSKLSRLRSSLYEDYREERLDQSEYLFLKAKLQKNITALQSRLDELFIQKHRLDTMSPPQNLWRTALHKWQKSETITRKLVAQLIERVEIFSDKRVSICFRHRDELQGLLPIMQAKGKAEML